MPVGHSDVRGFLHRFRVDLLVLLVSCCIFLPLVISPPHLMDDVDAVQAQIARNMLQSGDWVTARLGGIAYLEKSPLIYWMMAASFRVFGVHDWAARSATRSDKYCSLLDHCALRDVGVRASCGYLFRHDSSDVHWDISVHPHPDP